MVRESVSSEIRAALKDAVGSKVKIEMFQMVLFETRPDKQEPRVILLSQHRCYTALPKLPAKIESSFHFLEISSVESKSQKKLMIGLADGKHHAWSIEDEGKDLDQILSHIWLSLAGLVPSAPIEKLIANIDVKPSVRLKDATDKMGDVRLKALASPCYGFTSTYLSLCDYYNTDFMPDVAWDIDTIYLSHGTKEMNLEDFDLLVDSRQMIPIIVALEHNTWFTGFKSSNVKLSSSAQNELVRVLKNNTNIHELDLSNSGVKTEFVHRLSLSLTSSSNRQLTSLNLSDNVVEDKGISSMCAPLAKLNGGLVELKLSRTGLTAVGVNRVAETLLHNSSVMKSLRHLDLSCNSVKGEDVPFLFKLLAEPNVLTDLNLSSLELPLENLFTALLRGCVAHLANLDLSGNCYVVRKQQASKEPSVPNTWQQFFSSACAIRSVNFSNNRLPPEAVKCILVGITSNAKLTGVELNLSGNGLGSGGIGVLESCLPPATNISSLDLSDNGFDQSLASVVGKLSQNRSIEKLYLGRNLTNVKPRFVQQTMEAVVGLIQNENSPIKYLAVDDMKLKSAATILINALGLNSSLTHLDISGNIMGDIGARMLSKALQINKKLQSIQWDHNATSPNGFQYIALALEKNLTLKEMPTPVNDAAAALRTNATKTEQALQKIEQLLHRNHNTQRFAGDQEYRLQQGFLTSSTQQMDTLVVHIQDTLSKLDHISNVSADSMETVSRAKSLMKDVASSRKLLLELQKVASKAEGPDSTLRQKLETYSADINAVLTAQLRETVCDMLECAQSQCPVILEKEELVQSIRDSTYQQAILPENIVHELFIEQIGMELLNKASEIDLNVATHLSDRILDEATGCLEIVDKTLAAVLRNEAHTGGHLKGEDADSKELRKILLRTSVSSTSVDDVADVVTDDLPDKRTTLYNRRLRPMSIIGFSELQDSNLSAVVESNDVDSSKMKLASVSSQVDAEDEDDDKNVVLRAKESEKKDVSSDSVANPVPLPRKRKGVNSQFVASVAGQAPAKPGQGLTAGSDEGGVEARHPAVSSKPTVKDASFKKITAPDNSAAAAANAGGDDVGDVRTKVEQQTPGISERNSPSLGRRLERADSGKSADSKSPEVKAGKPDSDGKVKRGISVDFFKDSSKAEKSKPVELPVLNTDAPKLQHLGADRPRRVKKMVGTRPTVGLEVDTEGQTTDSVVDGGVNDFFTQQITASSPGILSPTINGDADFGSDKAAKKTKPAKSDSKGGGLGGFMRGLIKRGPSGGKTDGAKEPETPKSPNTDLNPISENRDRAEAPLKRSPANTLEKPSTGTAPPPAAAASSEDSKGRAEVAARVLSPPQPVQTPPSTVAADGGTAAEVRPTPVAAPRPLPASRFGLPGMTAAVGPTALKRVTARPVAAEEKPAPEAQDKTPLDKQPSQLPEKRPLEKQPSTVEEKQPQGPKPTQEEPTAPLGGAKERPSSVREPVADGGNENTAEVPAVNRSLSNSTTASRAAPPPILAPKPTKRNTGVPEHRVSRLASTEKSLDVPSKLNSLDEEKSTPAAEAPVNAGESSVVADKPELDTNSNFKLTTTSGDSESETVKDGDKVTHAPQETRSSKRESAIEVKGDDAEDAKTADVKPDTSGESSNSADELSDEQKDEPPSIEESDRQPVYL